MEILLSFVAGLVLAGVVAFFVLRSIKSAAEAAQVKALEDAAKQAEATHKAAVAKLESDLENAQVNLEQSRKDAEKHTQELLDAKEKAHKDAIEAIEKRHNDAMAAMEKRHTEAIEAERKRYEQALSTMKEQVQNATNQMLKERQADPLQLGCRKTKARFPKSFAMRPETMSTSLAPPSIISSRLYPVS